MDTTDTADATVQKWYEGRNILVTGGTGFMGKTFLEKMLRCLPVNKIYIIIREKRGCSPPKRLKNIIQLPLFNKIRETQPSLFDKLIAVDGDITKENFGIVNVHLLQTIQDTVSVVFHNAASLKLEADLKHAITFNTLGTRNTLEFCLKIKNLQSVLHLSTAFCHVDVEVLEEKIYPTPHNPNEIIKMVQNLDDKSVLKLQQSIIKPHPNGYTFSKRLSESLVEEYATKLPLSILRPSIVVPALHEPMPGWVDSLNGPVGILAGAGKGVIRTMMVDGTCPSEVIPVDIAINGMIVCAWHRAVHAKKNELPVFNSSVNDKVVVTWREVLDKGRKIFYEYPFDWPVIWYPSGEITTNYYWHTFLAFFLHTIPAYFIDFLMLIFMQPRFMLRVHERICVGLEVLQYFTMRRWCFKNKKFTDLINYLSPKEQNIFYMVNAEYDVDEFMFTSILGSRQYCLRDPLTTLPRARRILKFLYILHVTTKTIFYYGLLYLFLSIFSYQHFITYKYWSTLFEKPTLQGVALS